MIVRLDKNFTGYVEDNGRRTYYSNGIIHRDDGPAIVDETASLEAWYQYGRRHRDNNEPAVISPNLQEWWYAGNYHRDDGPAHMHRQLSTNGFMRVYDQWYSGGLLHRNDGPAIVRIDSENQLFQEWYHAGRLHRFDGPAVENWENKELVEYKWFLYGKLHRVGGPAYHYRSMFNFNLQNTDWYQDGKLHRLDGPAKNSKTLNDGIVESCNFIHGVQFDEESYQKMVLIMRGNSMINLFEEDNVLSENL